MSGAHIGPITPAALRKILTDAKCRLLLNDASLAALASSLNRGRERVAHLRVLAERERARISANRKARWRRRENGADAASPLPAARWGQHRSRRAMEARREGIAALIGTLGGLFPDAVTTDGVTPPTLIAGSKPSPLVCALVAAWPAVLGVHVGPDAVMKALAETKLAGRLLRSPTNPRRFSSKD